MGKRQDWHGLLRETAAWDFVYLHSRELPVPEPQNRVSSVIQAARNEHSAKPVEAYELIEKAYPEYSKLEMFSRTQREGWTMWGNQAWV